MRKIAKKPKAKRAPVKRSARGKPVSKRNETAEKAALPLEKLLHDTYARRAYRP